MVGMDGAVSGQATLGPPLYLAFSRTLADRAFGGWSQTPSLARIMSGRNPYKIHQVVSDPPSIGVNPYRLDYKGSRRDGWL